jgi:DNA-binding response OmpR family regulator
LILEDLSIVALDLAATLEDAGFDVLAAFNSCAQGLAWLQAHSPDIVILDIELHDGSCEEIARLLVERGIPFVVFSGTLVNEDIDPVFMRGTWISKPSPADAIAVVARSLAGVQA